MTNTNKEVFGLKTIQSLFREVGLYGGSIDALFGTGCVNAMHSVVKHVNPNYNPIVAVPTYLASDVFKWVQEYLVRAGKVPVEFKVDGKWGPASKGELEKLCNIYAQDNNLPQYSYAWTKHKNLTPEVIKKVEDWMVKWGKPLDHVSYLFSCFALETGRTFDPGIKNPHSGACLDTETEILTTLGWRKYNEIDVGTEIYSFNPELEIIERDKVLNILVKKSSDNFKMTSRSFSSVATHDHRWYLLQRFYSRTDNKPETVIKTTKELSELKSSHLYNIPHPDIDYCFGIKGKCKETPEFYTLLGLIAGDGSIQVKNNVVELNCHVGTKHEWELINTIIPMEYNENQYRIRDMGNGMFRWVWRSDEAKKIIDHFDREYNESIPGPFIKKLSPNLIDSLGNREARALIRGYMNSDGHTRNNGKYRSFRNIKREIIDDFMTVAVIAGENPRETAVGKRNGTTATLPGNRVCDVKDIYTVYLRDAKFTSCHNGQLKIEHFSEEIDVWCPTTNNQTWIARKDGTVYITGNCGLIQFMPNGSMKDLGVTDDQLKVMSVFEQLDWVFKYFEKYSYIKKCNCLEDYYLSIFYPAHVGKDPNLVVGTKGTKLYEQNSGFDSEKKGFYTVGDIASAITTFYWEGMDPKLRLAK